MKIWVDDIRKAPEGYEWCKSVNETMDVIDEWYDMQCLHKLNTHADLDTPFDDLLYLDLDHDAGDYAKDGGDYINILNKIERKYPDISPILHFHSMNPVGVENMRAIAQHNRWRIIRERDIRQLLQKEQAAKQ